MKKSPPVVFTLTATMYPAAFVVAGADCTVIEQLPLVGQVELVVKVGPIPK
jgi:hypothetical protein